MLAPILCSPISNSITNILNTLSRYGGSSWPSGLLKLYSFLDGLKTKVGSISWSGTPTIGVDGVVAGVGPSFGTVMRGSGKVTAIRVKLTKSSTGITGDEQILGPLYVRNGNLVAKLDGEEATHAHTWSANAVVDVRITASPSGLTLEDF